MSLRWTIFAALLVVPLLAGCMGQSRATGKYDNQDKPKPGESSDK